MQRFENMQDDLIKLIIQTAQELGEEELALREELSEETRLFGDDGILDSMGLVTLIIAVEQEIEDQFDKSVSLADEKALSQARSPYRTVSALAEYAADLIQGD
jgi:acyl carrier protein